MNDQVLLSPQTNNQNKFYYGLIFLFSLIFLWPLVLHPTNIPMTGIIQTTDFTLSHLSYAQYIHDSWLTYGKLPLWNSSMLSGMPLIADPLSGYFYIPNWLTFIFPKPITYNFLFVLHFFWTGCGLYLFLRSKCKHQLSPLVGALAWMGTPKLLGYLGSGQVSSVFALAWFPWLLLVTEKFANKPTYFTAVKTAVVLSIIVLIDIRWGYLAGLLCVSYFFYLVVTQKVEIKKTLINMMVFFAFLLLLTAVLTLPLQELMTYSERSDLTIDERGGFSLTLINLLGILMPQMEIYAEFITYFGIGVLILTLFGFSKKNRYWIALICFSVLFSLGTRLPFFTFFSKYVPGFEWLRVPSRFWFFVVLAAAILAAFGVDRIISFKNALNKLSWLKPIFIGVSLFAIMLAIGLSIFFPPLPNGMLLFVIILPFFSSLLFLFLYSSESKWIYLLCAVMVLDLAWFNTSVFRSIPLTPKLDVVSWLEAQPGLFRIYSPSANIVLPHRLQSTEGVNPTHLKSYSDFITLASKISTSGYSVSVPGIYLDENSPPDLYESASSPDLNQLGLLNVKYIVTNFPIKNLKYISHIFNDVYIFVNPNHRERVWFEGDGKAELTFWSPDIQITNVTANEDGSVVFSEIYFPGWRATINGQPVQIKPAYTILRSIQVPSGINQIILKYTPVCFYIGLTISGIGWILILILFGRIYVKPFMARIRSVLS